jgi:hypothetical protein
MKILKRKRNTVGSLVWNTLLVISVVKYCHPIETTTAKQGQAHEQSHGD